MQKNYLVLVTSWGLGSIGVAVAPEWQACLEGCPSAQKDNAWTPLTDAVLHGTGAPKSAPLVFEFQLHLFVD